MTEKNKQKPNWKLICLHILPPLAGFVLLLFTGWPALNAAFALTALLGVYAFSKNSSLKEQAVESFMMNFMVVGYTSITVVVIGVMAAIFTQSGSSAENSFLMVAAVFYLFGHLFALLNSGNAVKGSLHGESYAYPKYFTPFSPARKRMKTDKTA